MIDQLTSTVLEYRILFGLATLGILAYFVFDEVLDADDKLEGSKNVGERIDSLFGGFLGVVASTILVLTSLSVTLGTELIEFTDALAGIAANGPVVASQLLTLGLGTVSLLGILTIPASVFVVVGLMLLIGGLVWRKRIERRQDGVFGIFD